MIILPAIDLKEGKAVRLYQGKFETAHQVAEDPAEAARRFYEAGARQIHMVDLDGARDGVRKNSDVVRTVAELGLRIELGGGIRSPEDLNAVFEMGVFRAVIGSAAVSHPEFVEEAVRTFGPDRIAVGIDARDGLVRVSGWTENSGLDYLEFAGEMEALGVKKLIFTDIAADGMLSGPSFSRLKALQETVGCDIIASGGVSCQQDVEKLNAMGLYGVIIGKACYAGTIDLAQAVREGGTQC